MSEQQFNRNLGVIAILVVISLSVESLPLFIAVWAVVFALAVANVTALICRANAYHGGSR